MPLPGTDPEPRYLVRRDEHHGGGLFELEVTIRFAIVERATGRVVRSFEGGYSAHYDGQGWSDGAWSDVVDVVLAPDDAYAEVRYAGGRVERVPLVTDP